MELRGLEWHYLVNKLTLEIKRDGGTGVSSFSLTYFNTINHIGSGH